MMDLGGVTRQFSMEGATHLYSSLPFMLTPADLYSVKNNPAHKAALLVLQHLPHLPTTPYLPKARRIRLKRADAHR